MHKSNPFANISCDDKTIQNLRLYLDDVNFNGLYHNLVGVKDYHYNASAISGGSQAFADFNRLITSHKKLGLVQLLAGRGRLGSQFLSMQELDLCQALLKMGLIESDQDGFICPLLQLISLNGQYLFIDRRLNFSPAIHDIYIGPDSYLLFRYMTSAKRLAGKQVLDLCTGSGVIGICSAAEGATVVSTDLSEKALKIAKLNFSLNGLTSTIKLKKEELNNTLKKENDSYDVIACNPPFVASPDIYKSVIYAKGSGEDGLEYLRQILNKGSRILKPSGMIALVADLPGDFSEPHFVCELRDFAVANNYAVDVFIDNIVPAESNEKVMVDFLIAQNEGADVTLVQEQISHLYRNVLKAKNFFLTTMIARQSKKRTGVFVYNRYARDRFYHTIKV